MYQELYRINLINELLRLLRQEMLRVLRDEELRHDVLRHEVVRYEMLHRLAIVQRSSIVPSTYLLVGLAMRHACHKKGFFLPLFHYITYSHFCSRIVEVRFLCLCR